MKKINQTLWEKGSFKVNIFLFDSFETCNPIENEENLSCFGEKSPFNMVITLFSFTRLSPHF